MIRLAASDVDGTLLDRSHKLPPDFWEVVDALREKDVCFAIASGRSYVALRQNFQPSPQKLALICDNGACVVLKGEMIYQDTMAHDSFVSLVRCTEEYSCSRHTDDAQQIKLLLCGVNGTYHLDYGDAYAKEIGLYYNNRVQVEDLAAVQDEIYKLAIYDPLNPQSGSEKFLSAQFPNFSFQVSGEFWMDVMNQGTDKGKALAMLQKRLGVSYEETAAFGDYYNDLSLFREAYYSYCMANGEDGVKAHARFIAPSNAEYGVTETLKRLCGIG